MSTLYPMNLQLFAEGGEPLSGEASNNEPNTNEQNPATGDGDGGQQQPDSVTLTQEQLDALIDKAFAKGARKGKADAKATPAQAANPPQTEAPPATALEGATDVTATLKKAQRMCENAALTAAAAKAGFADPSDALALANRALLETDDDGNVDGAEDAIEELLKKKPHLLKREGPPAGGGVNPGGRQLQKQNDGERYAKRKLEQRKKSMEELQKLGG